jgi:hypothetical protein
MRFLNRKARTAKPAGKEEAPTVVYREIEITVQREWTSMTVRNPVAEGMEPPAGGEQDPAQPVPVLPAVTEPE